MAVHMVKCIGGAIAEAPQETPEVFRIVRKHELIWKAMTCKACVECSGWRARYGHQHPSGALYRIECGKVNRVRDGKIKGDDERWRAGYARCESPRRRHLPAE